MARLEDDKTRNEPRDHWGLKVAMDTELDGDFLELMSRCVFLHN